MRKFSLEKLWKARFRLQRALFFYIIDVLVSTKLEASHFFSCIFKNVEILVVVSFCLLEVTIDLKSTTVS